MMWRKRLTQRGGGLIRGARRPPPHARTSFCTPPDSLPIPIFCHRSRFVDFPDVPVHSATGHSRTSRPRRPLQSPSTTAERPDQPSNPPQATAPSFSLVGPASLSRSNRRGLAVVRWKGVNLNGTWRVRKLVAVEPSSGCHTRAPDSNRAESLLEAPLRRAVLEAVQVDRTESFFDSGAEWRRVRYGPQ